MADEVLQVEGAVRVHAVFMKKMGPKEYRMASVDLLDGEGQVCDSVVVFCPVESPRKLVLSSFKGQLSVRLE